MPCEKVNLRLVKDSCIDPPAVNLPMRELSSNLPSSLEKKRWEGEFTHAWLHPQWSAFFLYWLTIRLQIFVFPRE